MDALFFGLAVLGAILWIAGLIMVLVAAFKESIGWGLACLFVPVALLIFAVLHWDRAKTGFLVWLLGLVVLMGGGFLSGFLGSGRTEGEAKPPPATAPASP